MVNGILPDGHGEHRASNSLDPAVAKILARRRRELGWSLREAARRAGVSSGMVAMLEHGERAPSAALARELVLAYSLARADADALRSAALPGVGRDSPYRRATD